MCIQQNNGACVFVSLCVCFRALQHVPPGRLRSHANHSRDRDAHKYSSTRIHILLHTFALSHTHTHTRQCNTNTHMVLDVAVLRVSCCRTDLAGAGADSTPLTAPSTFSLLFFTPITHCRLERVSLSK